MKTYAVIHKEESVRKSSRSGGIFTALSDAVLKQNGVIYGAAFNSNWSVIHTRATNSEERNGLRGSKYVQSKLGDIFISVKKDLENGIKVLFSGTPCQIAGLRNFLKYKYPNLLCVDVVCHGVPSPKIWHDYLNWLSGGKNVNRVEFRNKSQYGWRAHVESITVDGRQIDSQIFKTLFYSHNIIRPSCFECKYKTLNHPGDITIADYWGIEKVAPEFDDNKGVSLVLVNTDKGEAWFETIKGQIKWKETRIEDSMQPPLEGNYSVPVTRYKFWNDYSHRSFNYIVRKYGANSKPLLRRIKEYIRQLM